jgi:hypothetical protein
VEGAEQVLLEGVPKPELGGDVAVEPFGDVCPVGPLGSGGEAEQDLGRDVLQQAPVGRRLAWWNSSTITTSNCSGRTEDSPSA